MRRGFGSLLVERGLKQDLRGEVRIDFEPSGVVCTIETAIEAIRSGEAGHIGRQSTKISDWVGRRFHLFRCEGLAPLAGEGTARAGPGRHEVARRAGN
jgi:hypothetical protein